MISKTICSVSFLVFFILSLNAQTKDELKKENSKNSTKMLDLNAVDKSNHPTKDSGGGKDSKTKIIRPDVHSFSNSGQAFSKSANLDLTIDFNKRIIKGSVAYRVELVSGNQIVFDTKGLDIHTVTVNGKKTKIVLGKKDPLLGRSLTVPISKTASQVVIAYSTTPESEGLQWLDNTNSGLQKPFVYSQGEAILTRSWIPIQDTPASKLLFNAYVNVPEGSVAVMGAESGEIKGNRFSFKMKYPIPPYLIALAAGDLVYKSISDKCGVYALPHVIEAAASEFENTSSMIEVAESIAGPYKWGKFDMLVLPEAFPFGGMENPMLTFLTPTIIAGDRSLVSLVAHELAHSWSGNLVTNQTWNDFWLNEGITVYLERRIVESLDGVEQASMHRYNGYLDLMATMGDMGEMSPDAHLKLDLSGRNPDDGMTDVAYEKGALFIEFLEKKVGRKVIDEMLKEYFNSYSFKSINTTEFLKFLNKYLGEDVLHPGEIDEWVHSAALPSKVEKPKPYLNVDQIVDSIVMNEKIQNMANLENYSVNEWLYFLGELINSDVPKPAMSRLFAAHKQRLLSNSEIKTKWFILSIKSDFHNVDEEIENFVMTVGRRKFLVPIYKAMKKSKMKPSELTELYKKARPNYHSITRGTLDELIELE